MRIFSAALIFGLAVTAQAQASALTPQHWYLPAKPGQWCAYPSEIAWQKASDAAFLSDSASAYVADGQVRSLRIFRSDEGGDWGLTDDYAFQDGVVVAVTRTYNSFEKGRVVDDFVLRDGKLVHAARRYFTMYGQPMRPKKGVDYDAHAPIYTRLDAMPFYRVVLDKPETGAICKPANPGTPAKPRA
jgi:hypothetical protein